MVVLPEPAPPTTHYSLSRPSRVARDCVSKSLLMMNRIGTRLWYVTNISQEPPNSAADEPRLPIGPLWGNADHSESADGFTEASASEP